MYAPRFIAGSIQVTAILTQDRLKVFINGGDGHNIEILYKYVKYIRRNKSRQGRPEPDILDAKVQKTQ